MHQSGWITDRRRYGSSVVGNVCLGAVPGQIGFGYWMSQGEGVEPREYGSSRIEVSITVRSHRRNHPSMTYAAGHVTPGRGSHQ
ncbi:hypothetical protein HMPREF9603_01978 [Cutibacterium acnes HL001PA1]|nr:hypothetical protein HMPREF9603_01978 [Cutibacterium acnes HL001PA1]